VAAASALAGVAGGSAAASTVKATGRKCEYFYNPLAGNFTTDTPPTSCDFEGLLPF
jgi:hypothetical protein